MHYAFYGGSCKAKLKLQPRIAEAVPVFRHILLQEVEHCPTESRYTLRTPKCTMHYRFASVQLMADGPPAEAINEAKEERTK